MTRLAAIRDGVTPTHLGPDKGLPKVWLRRWSGRCVDAETALFTMAERCRGADEPLQILREVIRLGYAELVGQETVRKPSVSLSDTGWGVRPTVFADVWMASSRRPLSDPGPDSFRNARGPHGCGGRHLARSGRTGPGR